MRYDRRISRWIGLDRIWIGFGLDFGLDWGFSSSVFLDLQMSTQVLTPGFPSAIGTGAYAADGCTWFLVALRSDLLTSTLLSCHDMKL